MLTHTILLLDRQEREKKHLTIKVTESQTTKAIKNSKILKIQKFKKKLQHPSGKNIQAKLRVMRK